MTGGLRPADGGDGRGREQPWEQRQQWWWWGHGRWGREPPAVLDGLGTFWYLWGVGGCFVCVLSMSMVAVFFFKYGRAFMIPIDDSNVHTIARTPQKIKADVRTFVKERAGAVPAFRRRGAGHGGDGWCVCEVAYCSGWIGWMDVLYVSPPTPPDPPTKLVCTVCKYIATNQPTNQPPSTPAQKLKHTGGSSICI